MPGPGTNNTNKTTNAGHSSRLLTVIGQSYLTPRWRLDLRSDSAFYQARTFLDGKQRQKSTETAQLRAAFKIAEDWYRRELRASIQLAKLHPIELTADPVMAEVFKRYYRDLEKKKQPDALFRWNSIQEFWASRSIARD